MFMTKDKVRQHLLNAPPGTDPGEIIEALRSNGVQMEDDPVDQHSFLEAAPVEDPSVGGFAGNILKSGGRLARDIGMGAINTLNPNMEQNTIANVAKLGIGGAANAIESVTGNEDTFDAPGEKIASGLGDFYKERYGSIESIKKSVYEDPVGVASDLATLLTGAGVVVKGVGLASKASTVGKVGSALSKAGTAIDPVADAARLAGAGAAKVGKLAGKGLSQGAERLYHSALKPTKAVERKFPNVVRTGLDEGIVVTGGSMDDVAGLIDDINADIGTRIEQGAKAGQVIPIDDVIQRLDETKAFFGNSIGGSKYLDELDALAETFKKERLTMGEAKGIPVDKAQKLKQNTYNILRKAYGELKAAETEGKKAMARGLKEEIAARVPEIGKLNERESRLIGLENALADFARRHGNREVFGLAPGVGVGVGSVTQGLKGGLKGAAISKFIKSVIDSPGSKSRLAILMDRLSKGKGLPAGTASKLGNVSAALRLLEVSSEQ